MTRTLNVIAFVVFASALFIRSTDPIIPQIADGLHVEPATAALLSTAFTLPYALVQPLLGALADMFSKARLMLLSMAIVVAATLVCGFAPNFHFLFAARVVAGLAAGGVVPISFALVGDMVPVKERQVAMGRLLFAIMTGNLLGATCAGVVGDLLGWRGVFFAIGGFGALALAPAFPGLRGVSATTGRFDLSTLAPNYRAIFNNPLAKICFGAVFLEALFMYGCFPYIATMLRQAGETRASIAGIVIAGFGIGGALYGVSVSRLLALLGETRMMRLGGAVMGFCLVVIAARLYWPLEFLNFALLGLGFYMLHAVIQIYASELAPAARGSAMALHSFFFFLGQAAGPIVYGAGLTTIGLTPVLLFGGAVVVGVGLTAAQWLRRPEPSAV
jgi:predicted MFS family arabinose efflux permease